MQSRYIKQVKLINFQDHKETTVDFTEGVNLIVGSSDAGKSAILRAVNFVFQNDLRGNSFIRVGTTECSVTIVFSDGVEITRVKSTDVNNYILKDENEELHVFSKVASTVPEQIQKYLGNPPLDDKKRPIAYADQMANLFLVDLNSSDLPRTLSELTGIQHLQTAAETLGKNARSYDRSIKERNDKIKKLNDNLVQYQYVDKDYESISTIQSELNNLSNTLENINKARNFIKINNEISSEAKKINNLSSKYKSLADIKPQIENLSNLLTSIKTSRINLSFHVKKTKEFKSTKADLDKYSSLCNEVFKNKLESVSGLKSNLETAEKYHNQNTTLLSSIEKVKVDLQSEQTNIEDLQSSLDDLIQSLKDAGDWCNACNRPLA
jgi:DNA repair exonuclease SbcCD ATPase subunit